MFEPQPQPRVFGIDLGVDIAEAFVEGVAARLPEGDPLAWANVTVWVNTRRLERRIVDVLSSGPARLHPTIKPITEFGAHLLPPEGQTALGRRLALAAIIRARMEADPSFGPASSAFALADSLSALFEEMSVEGIDAERLRALDVGDHADHWRRNLQMVDIARVYFDALDYSDAGARQRQAAEAQIAAWEANPPQGPVIVVGSTGSRGTTAMIMDAVAHLPNGAVILPGFDRHVPPDLWPKLGAEHAFEDHPQHRLAACLRRLELSTDAVANWAGAEPRQKRNALISLALRPAPVTDAWLRDGPSLGDPIEATRDVTLIEAAGPREEALAIALELRAAAEDRKFAALISPDRMLTRRVTAMLERWGITPDDSAGRPLALLPPGQFLGSLVRLMTEPPGTANLLAMLKHPLCHSSQDGRAAHMRIVRKLEARLRKKVENRLDAELLGKCSEDKVWTGWADAVLTLDVSGEHTIAEWVSVVRHWAEYLGRGTDAQGAGRLWETEAGEAALAFLTKLEAEGDAGGVLSPYDFQQTFLDLLSNEDVRDPTRAHPAIKIWGTLEARVQCPDIAILAGLNEGVWPSLSDADPWLNRALRREGGFLLPERRIGLQAHDFQQAAAAPRIVLSRAGRDGDADTVPARWLNRITNLLSGLSVNGEAALEAMRARGKARLAQARALDAEKIDAPKAKRPSPKPPKEARPRRLAVTQIQTLKRDPYAIYAGKVLDLSPLNPLDPETDARVRGIIVHGVLRAFVENGPIEAARLVTLAEKALRDVPEREMAALWLGTVRGWAGEFAAQERARQTTATPAAFEITGKMEFPDIGFTLKGTADRIDRGEDGALIIYDYKTGTPPSAKQMAIFDRQLLLEAMMAEEGAFKELGPADVSKVVYVQVGNALKETPHPLTETPQDFRPATVRAEFEALITAYLDPATGFLSRAMLESERDERDFDHLARLGEWDESEGSAS